MREAESGSVLIMAVVAMLILSVLSISFALLAGLETKIGVNFKHQGQAEALAEAGLEHARDIVRTAGTGTSGFTTWLNTVVVSNQPLPSSGTAVGNYWARVDNDCSAFNVVPAAIQEVPPGGVACNNVTDNNETAVITAWAEAGTPVLGRARVRGIVAVDSPWKHVCSNSNKDGGGIGATPAGPGYCNESVNRNGNPSVTPSDPNEYPGGPAAYDDLPRPILGCSRIDPTMHGRTAPGSPDAAQTGLCTTNPLMYTYPYPGHLGAGTPRFVLMGEDPAVVTGAKNCSVAGFTYFGYFDCALTTPCPAAVCGTVVRACVFAGDPRLADSANYRPNTGGCLADLPDWPVGSGLTAGKATGMVFGPGMAGFNTASIMFPSIGSQATRYTIYMLNANGTLQSNTIYGTLVVETDSSGNSCSTKHIELKTSAVIWAGPNTSPPVGVWGPDQYGYPVAVLVYDPDLADPTIIPTYAPQDTCANMGSAGGGGTTVHGIVYSGGHVEFNPFNLDGGVVAFELQTQSTSASYSYNTTYGNAAPPPGFPPSGGNSVIIVKKSFITCTTFSNDSGGATSCN